MFEIVKSVNLDRISVLLYISAMQKRKVQAKNPTLGAQIAKQGFQAYISFNLRDIMDRRHLSIDDVARLTHLTRTGVYTLVAKNNSMIKYRTLAMLCAGLNVAVEDLIVLHRFVVTAGRVQRE